MIIYKITNLENLKVYIGQTINTLEKRKYKHESEAKCNKSMPIARAIIKYGKDNFYWETIDIAKTREELNEKEKEWIWLYNTNDRQYGYNLSMGGNSVNLCPAAEQKRIAKLTKKLYQYDLNCKFLKQYNSLKEAEIEFNDKRTAISKVARGHKYSHTAFNYRWSYNKYDILPIKKTKWKRSVKIFDLNNNLLHIVTSLSEAQKITNVATSNIAKCCKNKIKQIKGYKFSYNE